MVKQRFYFAFLTFFMSIGFFQTYGQNQKLDRPALVVGIVVDQMRWDYLYRFYDRYEEGGFKRLLHQGFSFENMMINYLPSYTAVGHSIAYTGSVPAITGIVGNNWINQQTGEERYCTEDGSVQTVGTAGKAGEMSPENLLTTTVTDELRLASNFRSKVVGVSLKDRASILPAGHSANGAFWYDSKSQKFITSTYYMDELPDWVAQFNERSLPEKLMEEGWNTLYPIETYAQSSKDNVPWEGTFKGEDTPTFPHDMKRIFRTSSSSIKSTPFGNTLTLSFAKAAMQGYELGKGDFTDFLTINLASTDYVGHMYGPNSIEIEDTYLRLDQSLADFFNYLDQKVGKGNYLVFLTADHGGAHSRGFLKKHKLPSGDEQLGKVQKNLNKQLAEDFEVSNLVSSLLNYHVNYRMDKIRKHDLDLDKIKEKTVHYLKTVPAFQFVVDMENIGTASIPEPIKTMIINGYNYKRSGPVMIIPNPGWMNGNKTGTTHGSWAPYDTHLPLVFMGWNITHGSSNRRVRMSDIAPTIAALLHIQMGSGNVGKPLEEIFLD